MDAATDIGYSLPPDFQEDALDSLIELKSTDSTELWLLHWPINIPPNFDGQEVSLKLHDDGLLGSFQSSSGISYDVVSSAAQCPEASVFLSSASKSQIVGKIGRHVSLVHYPEPSELQVVGSLKHRSTSSTTATGTSTTTTTTTSGAAGSIRRGRDRRNSESTRSSSQGKPHLKRSRMMASGDNNTSSSFSLDLSHKKKGSRGG